MEKETKDWGINLVRVELKEIEPPPDVQETMNMVIKAENDKQSAIDFANAEETKADGRRRATIKEAEGVKQDKILKAQGEAEAIKTVAEAKAKEIELVNESARAHFKDNAITLERLQVTRDSLETNSKYILSKEGIEPNLIINETSDKVFPGNGKKRKLEKPIPYKPRRKTADEILKDSGVFVR